MCGWKTKARYSASSRIWRRKYNTLDIRYTWHLDQHSLIIYICLSNNIQIEHEKIPAKSTLVFDVEVLKIEDGPKPVNVFLEIDTDKDNRLSRKEVSEFLKKQLQQAQQHGDQGSAEDPDLHHMVDEIFMHEDKDKDDFITHDEFSGPKVDHDELWTTRYLVSTRCLIYTSNKSNKIILETMFVFDVNLLKLI